MFYMPWISRMGDLIKKKIGELTLVDSDSTGREEHAYIGHSSGWAKFFELGAFEFLKFRHENATFSAIISIFSPLEGGIPPFRGLNVSSDLQQLYGEKIRDILDPLPPITH